jgi:predicted Fe-Mo cluster-binding NifX family protein
MKIAVASDDQINIADHFGRTRGFIVYSITGNKIAQKEYIENNVTGHSQGHHHEHGSEHGHHHSHEGILNALKESEVIISKGMGRRLLEDFESAGKKVFITWALQADDAVKLYLDGNLLHNPDKSCSH